MNIVCFPHAGGQASTFKRLKDISQHNIISYEYNAHGSKINLEKHTSFENAVSSIADDIYNMNLEGIILFGHSMGAYIAYEAAFVLENKYNKKVNAVIVSGQVPPHMNIKSNIKNIDDRDFKNYLIEMGGVNKEVINNNELLSLLLPIIRSDYELLDTYKPNKANILKAPITVFVGDKDEEVVNTDINQWGLYSRDLIKVKIFNGNHFYLNDADNLNELVLQINKVVLEVKNKMCEQKYCWAPTVKWEVMDNDKIRIENFILKGDYVTLFPKFYKLTCKGVLLSELKESFKDFNKVKLDKFIKKLTSMEILISCVQEIDALFYSQENLFSTNFPYDEELRINEEKLNEFKKESILRTKDSKANKSIQLDIDNDTYDNLKNRSTTRIFDTSSQIKFEDFSRLFLSLSQRFEGKEIKYFYPSAGGLYPIDIYICVKDNRVENIDKGIYYYNPTNHNIELLSTVGIDKNCHYFQNEEIFESSAFSVYLVYNAKASMPKYGGMAYYYGIIEAGIIEELLSVECEKNKMGSCIIGEMNFRSIREDFNLKDNEIYLMCMEFGYKNRKEV